MATPSATVELDHLLKLRAIVGRFGEMDVARWWNTTDQLGPVGAMATKRGLPRTHRFAQARSVFAVGAHCCAEIFQPPRCVTLGLLPPDIEEAFDAQWEHSLLEGERLATVSIGSYFGDGVETEEQRDAALTGIRDECSRLIGSCKNVIVQ